jgi:hypothetical protein
MAQNNEVGPDKGGGTGGGGGGGPLNQSCTYTYQPGIGGIIPGPQNINTLPAPYQGYPTTNVTLRVQGGTQAASGDIMCSSYNTSSLWTYIVGSELTGNGPLFNRGCCTARWLAADNGGTTTVEDVGGPNGPVGIGDLLIPDGNNGTTTNCPPLSEIQTSIDGLQFLYNGQPLSQECCTKDITGVDVNYVVVGGKAFCYKVNSNPCPPIEAISISPDQITILGVTNQECCNSDVTGINNVYWDPNSKSCKIGQQTTGCTYQEIILQSLPAHDGPGTEQVFGLDLFGHQVSLTQECCTTEVTGYNVVWNPILGICEKLSTTQSGTVSITINENPISVSGCTDLIVSAKLFFSQPLESCVSGDTVASLLPLDPNIIVEQLGIFDSSVDGYNNWVDLGIRLIGTNVNNFDIILNIGGGIIECCNYDIRLDNIRVDCFKEEDRIFFDNKKCVGFDLVRVIDNKKSWVYNPGTEDVGIKLDDGFIRDRGDFTLIQGYGDINRTFAPSVDADIPWRYTDYYEQSNILEPHSDLVINSKELELTFNMCSSCCVNYNKCPDDYSLITTTGGTEYCSKNTTFCPSGFTLSNNICYSSTTSNDCDCLNIEWELSGTSVSGFNYNLPYTTFVNSRRAWVFDVSGVTHTLEWNNTLPAWVIYGGPGTSTAEYIYTADTQCPISTLVDWSPVSSPLQPFSNLIISSGICTTTTYTANTVTTTLTGDTGLYCTKTLSLLELESYKKVFQSFWVRMIEQFVPATTIFIAGERWCNNDTLICSEFNECDYDFEYFDSEITVIEYGTDYVPYTGHTITNGGDVPTDNGSDTVLTGTTVGDPHNSSDGPIITDGTVVIPAPTEPGNPIVVTTDTSVGNNNNAVGKNPALQQQVQTYLGTITNGGVTTIFK